jgi:hypothetical protein
MKNSGSWKMGLCNSSVQYFDREDPFVASIDANGAVLNAKRV